MITLYGIKNCDTVRKARRWLESNAIEYCFHDFREDGINSAQIKNWTEQMDWQTLLNKRSTTWKTLPEEIRQSVSAKNVATLLAENPTLIKRPVLISNERVLQAGFKPEIYQQLFS